MARRIWHGVIGYGANGNNPIKRLRYTTSPYSVISCIKNINNSFANSVDSMGIDDVIKRVGDEKLGAKMTTDGEGKWGRGVKIAKL